MRQRRSWRILLERLSSRSWPGGGGRSACPHRRRRRLRRHARSAGRSHADPKPIEATFVLTVNGGPGTGTYTADPATSPQPLHPREGRLVASPVREEGTRTSSSISVGPNAAEPGGLGRRRRDQSRPRATCGSIQGSSARGDAKGRARLRRGLVHGRSDHVHGQRRPHRISRTTRSATVDIDLTVTCPN
jgi:hypothetical protein